MDVAVSAAVHRQLSESSALSVRTSIIPPKRLCFGKVPLVYRNVSNGGRVKSIKAQVTTEAPTKVAKVSKKMEECVITNKFRPKDPYVGKCLLNTKITRDDAPGETWHMVFSTEGDLKPGADVKITGPVGKEMLMPKDPIATAIMIATGTGIAPFRAFLWKMFFEKHEDYQFNGLAWLFLGVPTSSSLLYKEEFEKMKEKNPNKFRLDFAVSREQSNEKGEKMYFQTRMAQYAEELWELLKKRQHLRLYARA